MYFGSYYLNATMKNLLILFTFFISLLSFSQELTLTKGEILKDRQFLIDNHEISVSDDDGNFISIRPHRVNGTLRDYYVELYDTLNFDSRLKVSTQNQTEILDAFILTKKVFIFIKELHKNKVSLRFDQLDLVSKKISHKTIVEINKNDNLETYKALKNDGNISIDYSNNILISYSQIKNKTLSTQILLFNQQLEKILDQKVLPNSHIKAKNVSFLNMFQSNDLVYLLFNYKDQDGKKFYQLIELQNFTQRELTIPIKHNFYEIVNSNIKNNNYIISGLTSEKRKGGYKGFSYYKINLNSFKLIVQEYTPFISEDVSKYFTGFFKGNRDIDIRDIFTDNQGNTYLIGQFYKTIKQAVPILSPFAVFSVGAVAVYITYNPINIKHKVYDDILIAQIDNNGKIVWDKLLELRQTKKIKSISYTRDSSYFTFFENNQINILMNGFINIEKDKLLVKQDKRKNKTNFYNITINPEGNITPNVLLSNSESDIIFKADKTIISNTNIHILGQGNMRKQLLRISFK